MRFLKTRFKVAGATTLERGNISKGNDGKNTSAGSFLVVTRLKLEP